MPYREYPYKAIIALNNTGVYLIQHGLIVEAIDTLKDAIRFMKESLSTDGTFKSACFDSPVQYDTALQQAWGRKSSINPFDAYGDKDIKSNRMNIVVISDQDAPTKVFDQITRNPDSLFCMTIDPDSNAYLLNDEERFQMESAVILYNYGIAFRYIATNSVVDIARMFPSTTPHSDAFSTSFHVLELTRTITARLLLSDGASELMSLSSNVLVTSLLVLHTLHQMSYENFFLFDLQKYFYSDLEIIVAMIRQLEDVLLTEGHCLDIAPAA